MKLEQLLVVFGALMIGGAVLAKLMKPDRMIGAGSVQIDLATLVPQQFGHWRIDASRVPVALPTELDAQQKEVYDQMLVRTYMDDKGERIMLTIAYGGNQSRHLQVHRPEVCYMALGFNLLELKKTRISDIPNAGSIPAMQMVAAQRARNEPVTYWIRIGDRIVRGNVELGLARLTYGLRGNVADGLLFRVSSITNQNKEGFDLQHRFIRDLLASVAVAERRWLIGGLAKADR